ncbi:hypothetical protein SEPCBS57363_003702 [Sporothrix epigloea]|uniref:Uncharacterized protein n=1 Tax=Sporothrix epigloea TaxID=1892477 RepID=A0ABP0DMX0_9PEZI
MAPVADGADGYEIVSSAPEFTVDAESATALDLSTTRLQQQATVQDTDGPASPEIPLQVAQLHLRVHEALREQKDQNKTSDSAISWPKRWLRSRQSGQQQGRGAGIWESSFDGPSTTAGIGLVGAYTTGITHKVSDNVTCSHQLVLTANTSDTATLVGPVVAGPSAAAATASNKAVGSWATKKNGKRAKLAGNMSNAPMKLMWLLNPREMLFQWAQARSEDAERLMRKKQKKEARQRRKAAARLKAKGLPQLSEEDEELAQQLQDALVGVDNSPPGAVAASTANSKAKGKAIVIENNATVGPSGQGASTITAETVPTRPLSSIHEEVGTTSSIAGHRLITQYGRIWVPLQTPHGEEESVAAAGDGASMALYIGDDGDVLDQHSGIVAPPNSVADSGCSRQPIDEQDSDSGQFQPKIVTVLDNAVGPSIIPFTKRLREISERDDRSFVTCLSQQ